jgi:uncharacterized phiE125 gp8 family phage protein
MTPLLIAGPAVEPVSLPEMRAYLRLDDSAEDDLVTALVKAARLVVEAASGRQLVEQTWRLVLDRWPCGRKVLLPLSPLIRVERVRVFDAAGAPTDLASALVRAESASDPPHVVVAAGAPEPGLPAEGIHLDVAVGFGPAPADVPAPLAQGVRMLVARWFENRGDSLGDTALPPDVAALVAPYRRARL